jgi:hypothetical protein
MTKRKEIGMDKQKPRCQDFLWILGLKGILHGFYCVDSKLQGDCAVGKAEISESISISVVARMNPFTMSPF